MTEPNPFPPEQTRDHTSEETASSTAPDPDSEPKRELRISHSVEWGEDRFRIAGESLHADAMRQLLHPRKTLDELDFLALQNCFALRCAHCGSPMDMLACPESVDGWD